MKYSLGIALSGGGVRGIAHIGVLQCLEDHGYQPEIVSGTSAGALVGTLYAAGMRPAEILEIFTESSLLKLFKLSLPKIGLTNNAYIVETLEELLPKNDFSVLQKPLYVSVTNMSSGNFELRHEGQLFEYVAASAAIPILFKAWEINGQQYVDGGVLNNLPVEPLRNRCEKLIGVNVTPIEHQAPAGNLITVADRVFNLVMWANVEQRLKACDVVIEPPADAYHLFQLNKAEEIYKAGYETTQSMMPEIRAILGGRAHQ
ncbi:MAG: patatin-like phospholipase family protein [Bacteroidota bacterium]